MVKFYIKTVVMNEHYVVVDYEIILSNSSFEGAIGGGRTEIPVHILEESIDLLRTSLEKHIEQTVGISPMDKTNSPQQEEDPL